MAEVTWTGYAECESRRFLTLKIAPQGNLNIVFWVSRGIKDSIFLCAPGRPQVFPFPLLDPKSKPAEDHVWYQLVSTEKSISLFGRYLLYKLIYFHTNLVHIFKLLTFNKWFKYSIFLII